MGRGVTAPPILIGMIWFLTRIAIATPEPVCNEQEGLCSTDHTQHSLLQPSLGIKSRLQRSVKEAAEHAAQSDVANAGEVLEEKSAEEKEDVGDGEEDYNEHAKDEEDRDEHENDEEDVGDGEEDYKEHAKDEEDRDEHENDEEEWMEYMEDELEEWVQDAGEKNSELVSLSSANGNRFLPNFVPLGQIHWMWAHYPASEKRAKKSKKPKIEKMAKEFGQQQKQAKQSNGQSHGHRGSAQRKGARLTPSPPRSSGSRGRR